MPLLGLCTEGSALSSYTKIGVTAITSNVLVECFSWKNRRTKKGLFERIGNEMVQNERAQPPAHNCSNLLRISRVFGAQNVIFQRSRAGMNGTIILVLSASSFFNSYQNLGNKDFTGTLSLNLWRRRTDSSSKKNHPFTQKKRLS